MGARLVVLDFVVRGLVVHALFFTLLLLGWYLGALYGRRLVWFGSLWIAGLALSILVPTGLLFFLAFVALLDIALILIVIGRDIPLP